MADTLLNHALPFQEWVDLYDLSSISVGTPIAVENVGSLDVYVTVRATEPPIGWDSYNIVKRDGDPLRNSAGDSGAWAFCYGAGGKVNIRPVI
jgi:hypothetical protein